MWAGFFNNKHIMDLGFISSLAQMVPELTSQFNGKYQTNQLAIAEANARSAEAIAANTRNAPDDNKQTKIIIGVVVAIVVIGIFWKLSNN